MSFTVYNDGNAAFYKDFYATDNDRHVYEEIGGGALYDDGKRTIKARLLPSSCAV